MALILIYFYPRDLVTAVELIVVEGLLRVELVCSVDFDLCSSGKKIYVYMDITFRFSGV